ncbi:MAG: SIR2 family protein [Planctomycetota bacterium]
MKSPELANNNLFLVGAGLTKAVFPNAPLNKDLLPVLCKGTGCTTLKGYYRKQKADDIEILLTHLDLEILRPKAKKRIALQQVRKAIQQDLAEYFRQFRFREEIVAKSVWLEDFVNLFQAGDAIISLNYDCFIEGALDYYGVWSPNGGYGSVENFLADKLPPNPKCIVIYKVHGSENFIISSGLPDENKKDISFEIHQGLFPRSGKYRCVGGGALNPECYIIAPSFVKVPHECIERAMIDALKVAGCAKNLVIIGCGLRAEDGFLWLLLTNFLNQKRDDGKLVIVDPCAESIEKRILVPFPINKCNFWIRLRRNY